MNMQERALERRKALGLGPAGPARIVATRIESREWQDEQAKSLALKASLERDRLLRKAGLIGGPAYMKGPPVERYGRSHGQMRAGKVLHRPVEESGKVFGGQLVCNITGRRIFSATSQ